jgi:hypothetical protein
VSENYLPEIERFSEHTEGAAHRRNYREMPWDKDPFWGGAAPSPFAGLGGKDGFDPAACRAVAAAAIKSGQIRVPPPPRLTPQKKAAFRPAPASRQLCRTCKVGERESGSRTCADCARVVAAKKLAREEKAAASGLGRKPMLNANTRKRTNQRRRAA